ncbi:hypothetical protein Moror_3023 [Moniliophthora roreri MCA 2997]|uniref:Uncharacterized protein n=1 Tax=Moniliophthora roreri (strain MCA 2997) TaxID=1381753 RepID=V2YAH8_MONRO|nr:hypothetical protein Moror_3023 [Moniliophthora roreri MCA 2997]KAI3616364.1 hypothetical protein WG66_012596 [Moniliophthora roreri]
MAHWYPEGYVNPPSIAFPPAPQHPAYTTKIQVVPGQPVPCSSSSRTPRGGEAVAYAAVPPHRHAPVEPLADFAYFKIGHIVRIRSPKKAWPGWLYGEVMYPVLAQDSIGRPPRPTHDPGRVYTVKYFQPWEGNWRQGNFSPDAKEIAPVLSGDEYVEPGPTCALARLKLPNGAKVWAYAQIQGDSTDRGVPVRIMAGNLKGSHVLARDLLPYDRSVAKALQQQHCVIQT